MDLSVPASSNRILYDVPCAVCRDHSSGKHYGVFACDGCAGFFKRSVRRDRQYVCKARARGHCLIDKAHRNQCRACRLNKCLHVGMNRDAVQHERGPRNSTIHRQMAILIKETAPAQPVHQAAQPLEPALNIKQFPTPMPMPLFPSPYYARLGLMIPSILTSSGPFTGAFTSPMIVRSEVEALCESAARILFMNIKWACSVPEFISLSLSDRFTLLIETWRDLFILAAAQFLFPFNVNLLCNNANPDLRAQVDLFERVLTEFTLTRPDTNEFAFLRSLMLFKTNIDGRDGPAAAPGIEIRRLQDVARVAALQDYSRVILTDYIRRAHPLEPGRINQIYQLLNAVKLVAGQTIVQLFFRPTIGETAIEKIICDMYMSKDVD